nr:RNA-directed DNA polymerase, eukaryota [Tanacetum cinerariifolium]
MSIYKAPKGVLHEMEMIRNKFFVGADSTVKKINWVTWDKVLASKKHGGLGVSSYYALNRTLLLKWVWRFISQDGSLWSRVNNVIYGSSIEPHALNFSSCWNSILREDGVESHQWSELNSLFGSFIFSLSSDRWSCDLNGEGMFRVKDIRSVLDDLFLPSSNEVTRWAIYISIKVNVFAWRARLDHLLTRDNLAKRGVIMDSSLCPICGLFPENAQHLFFGCDLAISIALRICHWWNLNWTEISSFAEWNSWSIFDDPPPKRSLLFDDIVSFSFNELALEKQVKELNNIVFKRNQSAQTVHMLTKPQFFYDHSTRQALGFQNPCYLKRARQLKPQLYDDSETQKNDAIVIHDLEETLMLEDESRSKMFQKQNDPIMSEKKVITKPVD